MLINIIATIAATLFITGVQKYLSTRKFWLLGAIIPFVSAAVMGILFYTMNVAFSAKTILPCVVIIVVELLIWVDGRNQYKRSALNKMKAKDI